MVPMKDNDIFLNMEGVHKKYTLKKYRFAPLHKGIFMNFFNKSYVYALKNINLKIRKGECVAIIGPNGSGKSTLLLIMSNILVPNEGRILINDSVRSIMHLGLNFQEDLTAIENIYLYGVIFGLSRKEISKRIDKIIKFADLKDFIHVPLRNFSSGMKSRLAFSIAIHTDPQSLVLDEILSVGDASFQRKCISFFEKFKKQKKTLILVSHDLGIVRKHFERCIYLSGGEIVADGQSAKVIKKYLRDVRNNSVKRRRIVF